MSYPTPFQRRTLWNAATGVSILILGVLLVFLVWLTGRKDKARDPRLTLWVLFLLAGFPLLSLLPKVEVEGLPTDPAILVRWLPWVWRCFSSQGYWRPRQRKSVDAASVESTE